MNVNNKILRPNQEGFGLLVEKDAGFINPKDERNEKILKENFQKIGKVDPSNYGKTIFPLELYVVLQKEDVKNQNGRIYPTKILRREVDRYKGCISQNTSGGELEHSENSNIDLNNLAHRITDIWWEEHTVMGKILIYVSLGFVNTGVVSTNGDKVALWLSYGHRVGVSSRGVGSVKKIGGVDYVQEDFEIICFDIVSTPSTPNAWILTDQSEKTQFIESTDKKKETLLEQKMKKFLLK